MPSKRVLTLTVEFHVPEGLRHDVRGARITKAVDQLTAAVQGATPGAFPWADRMVVSHDWSYRHGSSEKKIALPTNEYNNTF